MAADLVIVAFRPKPGREEALERLAREHVPRLRGLELVTERAQVILRARDGTVIEVFEWRAGAMAAAHAHPQVQALWGEFAEVCDYVPLRDLPEAADLFAVFELLEG